MILNITIVIAFFLAMEFAAWFTHKYIMHGFLWSLHRDHHHRDNEGFFEKNDAFFLIFAVPGMLFLYLGMVGQLDLLFWAGLGITLYGIAYFLVHDIFIHQRFRIFRNTDSFYFRALRRAHKTHHKYMEKHDGECFGMLLVPMKFFKQEWKRKR